MIYEYKCEECQNVQEVWHKMAEKNTEPCNKCNASVDKMKKIMSVPAGPHISWSKWSV